MIHLNINNSNQLETFLSLLVIPTQLTCTRWPRLYRGRKSFNGCSSPIDNSNPLFANATFFCFFIFFSFFSLIFAPIKQRSRYLSERFNHDDVATGEIAEAWSVSTPRESFPSASFVIALNRISKRFCSLFAVYVTWDKIVNVCARRYTGWLEKKIIIIKFSSFSIKRVKRENIKI